MPQATSGDGTALKAVSVDKPAPPARSAQAARHQSTLGDHLAGIDALACQQAGIVNWDDGFGLWDVIRADPYRALSPPPRRCKGGVNAQRRRPSTQAS